MMIARGDVRADRCHSYSADQPNEATFALGYLLVGALPAEGDRIVSSAVTMIAVNSLIAAVRPALLRPWLPISPASRIPSGVLDGAPAPAEDLASGSGRRRGRRTWRRLWLCWSGGEHGGGTSDVSVSVGADMGRTATPGL